MNQEDCFPRLESERLLLRALCMEDTDFLFNEWSNPKVTFYMRDQEPLTSRKQAEEFLRPLQALSAVPTSKWWGIELKTSGCLIGTCGFFRWDRQHRRAEIGYDLCTDVWGMGLMPEALGVLIQHGFDEMKLNRIEATTHVENLRSQRVLQKLGFQREGLLREYFCQNGVFNDQVQFSLLQNEWLQ